MQKILYAFIIFFLTTCVISVFAAPVSTEQVRRAGKNFLAQRNHFARSTQLAASADEKTEKRFRKVDPLRKDSATIGYLMQLEPKGYILMAADDHAPAVKLYSEDGSFDQLPPGFRAVIEAEMQEDLTWLAQIPEGESEFHQEWKTLLEDANSLQVANSGTYLLNTSWNQNSPYNYYCPAASGGPDGRAYAGCGATALAQILRYHHSPVAVSSDYSYTDSAGSCTGVFSISDAGLDDYNWSNMPVTISSTSATEQKEAVGQLIYHCGVAMDSNYEYNATSSYPHVIPSALRNYFEYICNDYVNKSSYTATTWFNNIVTDIDANHPIYYVMWQADGSSGHAVVCDGYNSTDGTIHLNLGWSGSGTAWYNLSSVSYGGYTWTIHGAVFNITPTTYGSLGITIESVSNQEDAHPAVNIINGNGLNSDGTHVNTCSKDGDDGNANWQTGDLGSASAVADVWIEFDLGTTYDITSMHIWNHNRGLDNNETIMGIKKMNVLMSTDGSTWEDLGEYTLTQAPGLSTYTGEDYTIEAQNHFIRYVKFDVNEAFGSYNGMYQACLSEVQFTGTVMDNQNPTVDAGSSQQVIGLTATLAGSASDDGFPNPVLSYTWTKLSSDPNEINVIFADVHDPTTAVTFSEPGFVTLQLAAYDGEFTAADAVTIHAIPSWWTTLDGVTIQAVSQQENNDIYSVNNIVNGNGLNPDGSHSNAGWPDAYNWQTGDLGSESAVGNQFVIFNLGASPVEELGGVRIWNFNRINETMSGIETMHIRVTGDINIADINVANDPNNWEDLGEFTIPEAPGQTEDYSIVYELTPTTNSIRYVRFDTFTIFGSGPGGYQTNLSEVRFSGIYENPEPDVDAGEDQITWLIDGSRTFNPGASASDDGLLQSLSIVWTKESGPDGYTFDPSANITNPNIILSETGTYVFKLEAYDGEWTVSDTITAMVYADACAHAKAQPGFVAVPGDIDGNCEVNIGDFALLAQDWLQCVSSDCGY